jgi:3-oxoacyl-[acyl-carrier protein] reductase
MSESKRVAIVTGSASGIGAATATLFARRGWNVTVNYSQNADGAAGVVRACAGHGADALACRADVGEDADCRRMAAETLARWGRIDALVNCAGTTRFASHRDLEALSGEDFLRVYRVNVVGAYQMARAVAGPMKTAGRGAIVNISSLAGIKGTGSSMAYATSKAALNVLTVSLARALGPEVRVNALCPGMTDTPWMRNALGPERYAAQEKFWQQGSPLARVGTPEDVAEAVLWFVEAAPTITGQVLTIDSGFSLGTLPPHAR